MAELLSAPAQASQQQHQQLVPVLAPGAESPAGWPLQAAVANLQGSVNGARARAAGAKTGTSGELITPAAAPPAASYHLQRAGQQQQVGCDIAGFWRSVNCTAPEVGELLHGVSRAGVRSNHGLLYVLLSSFSSAFMECHNTKPFFSWQGYLTNGSATPAGLVRDAVTLGRRWRRQSRPAARAAGRPRRPRPWQPARPQQPPWQSSRLSHEVRLMAPFILSSCSHCVGIRSVLTIISAPSVLCCKRHCSDPEPPHCSVPQQLAEWRQRRAAEQL